MDFLLDPQLWFAFLTLTVLEIVLGIDNIIFLAILVGRLPPEQQAKGRVIGLGLAMGTRILLLLSLAWLARLTAPWFEVFGEEISGRDLVLLLGGLFLIYKSTVEIHNSLEGAEEAKSVSNKPASFLSIVIQIAIIDIVFSLDSVITAVGLVDQVSIMVAAIVIAVLIMMWASGPISQFVDAHPTVKMLALSFLIMIGVALVAESLDLHIPKGYIYFAMAFSVGVEMLNIRLRKKGEAVQLRKRMNEE
ncbi:MAG: TerC family protein [Gammaproteobacteria bacterium]|nr:TerC family protein [Gammaproteobacteria bacterium]